MFIILGHFIICALLLFFWLIHQALSLSVYVSASKSSCYPNIVYIKAEVDYSSHIQTFRFSFVIFWQPLELKLHL